MKKKPSAVITALLVGVALSGCLRGAEQSDGVVVADIVEEEANE